MDAGQMDANLMRAAGSKPDLQITVAVQVFEYPIFG
jgi:hypothetical protein